MPVGIDEALRRLEGRGLKPLEDFPGAASRIWLLECQLCGNRVQESLHSLEKRSRPGCRTCCSKSQNRISDQEATSRLAEFSLTPLEPYPGKLNDKWRVSCGLCGDQTTTTIATLQNRKLPGCSQCGLAIAKEANSVGAEQAIERLARLGLVPLEDYPGHAKAPWRHRCTLCGFEDDWSLNYVESKYPCRKCRNASSAAERAASAVERMIAAGAKPLVPYSGASEPWKSECLSCGKEISPTLMSAERQSPCKFCARRAVSEKRLAEARPRAETQFRKSGFEPIGEFKGFTRPWKARCLKCGEVSSPAAKWLAEGHGCRWCAPNAPWTEQRFVKVLKLANRTNLEPFAGASTAIAMRCGRCGAEAKVKPKLLLKSKGFCNRCKPTAEWSADKAKRLITAAGMKPLEPYVNMTTPWRAVCLTCGTEGSPQLGNIAAGQGGCKVCGNYGFDINKPTTLYVLLNRELGAVKVGITNTGSVRLRSLKGVGFVPGKLYEFNEGSEPLRIETLLLRHFKKELGLKQALKQSQMRGVGGATETFWADELSTSKIYSMIRKLMS